jgi:glycosyltransferase involved in cell wall biosynthesis
VPGQSTADGSVSPGTTKADSRYAAPQKAFGYMVRGKPILAGDVPCHRELFVDNESAVLYELTPKQLAERLIYLANHPDLATRIARGAWEQSIDYNFPHRVDEILSLVNPAK